MAVDKLVDSTQLNSDLTSIANAIRTKGGTSAQLAFPSGFVSAVEAIPTGGGGGVTVVASGEFVGNSSAGRQTISIGTKMAQTDFYILIKAQDNSEFVRDGYSLTFLAVLVPSAIGHYNLSTTGDNRPFVSDFPVYDNNGTLTQKNAGFIVINGGRIESGNTAVMAWNTFQINKQSNTFQLYFGHSNQLYNLPSNITYEYSVVYFGGNPNTDIIEL